jgi:hypothetical protein
MLLKENEWKTMAEISKVLQQLTKVTTYMSTESNVSSSDFRARDINLDTLGSSKAGFIQSCNVWPKYPASSQSGHLLPALTIFLA